MKLRAINLFICFALSLSMYGQTNPEKPETPSTEPQEIIEEKELEIDMSKDWEEDNDGWGDDGWDGKDKNFTINIGRDHHDRDNILRIGMVDFGISTYIDENNSLDLQDEIDYMDQRLGRSINIGIHLVNIKLGLRKKDKPQNIGFSTGIKWNIVHYSMEKDYAVNKNADTFQDGIDFNVPALKHNRLKANHIQIPFLLEFNSKPNKPSKSFNLAAGMTYQLLLNSNFKTKTDEGVKNKVKGDFNLAKSMALLEVRAGYGPLNFYVQYGPRLFQEGDGPELQPLNFGINIIPR